MIELPRSFATPVPMPAAARAARGRQASMGLAAAVFVIASCSGTSDGLAPPAPSFLSFEEAAAGHAALTVYEASQDLVNRAWADPGQDWTTELEQVAADPYRSDLLTDLQSAGRDDTASSAYASDLTTTTSPTVVDVDLAAGVITLTDCLNGAAVDAEVHRAADGRWLVTEHTPNPDQTC